MLEALFGWRIMQCYTYVVGEEIFGNRLERIHFEQVPNLSYANHNCIFDLESSCRVFSPQSRVSIKSGGLSEPPLFPPTIDLGLSPSWLFRALWKSGALVFARRGSDTYSGGRSRKPQGLVAGLTEWGTGLASSCGSEVCSCTVHCAPPPSSTSLVSAVQVCPQRPSLVAAAPPRPPVQLQSGFRIGRRCSTKTKTRWPVSSVARGAEPVRRHHARPRQHPPPIFHRRPGPRRASRGKQGGHGGLWRPCLEKVGLVIDYMVGQRLHLESRSKAAHNSVIKGILPIWQDRHRHNQQANAVGIIASLFSKWKGPENGALAAIRSQTTNQKTEILQQKKRKMKEITHQCQQKGSSSLIPWKVIGRTITGPYPKLLQPWLIKLLIELLMDFFGKWETSDRLIWHHVALCSLSEIKEQKFSRVYTLHNNQGAQLHILHNNCLKMQSGRAPRKKEAKNTSCHISIYE